MFDRVLQVVNGKISRLVCKRLADFATDVADDGVILDLYCSEGRSTVIMATALAGSGDRNIKVVSVDTHITDPLSSTPYEDGTMSRFYAHLRRFQITNIVIPVTTVAENVTYIFNRRAVNLVVVQAPECAFIVEDALEPCIEVAQYVIRRGGKIVLIRPPHIPSSDFRFFVGERFGSDFYMRDLSDDLISFEYVGKEVSVLPS